MFRSFANGLMCRNLNHSGGERNTPKPAPGGDTPERDERIPIGPLDC